MNSLLEIHRSLTIPLPRGRSAFLWGPRKTGKTTLLRQLFPKNLRYDLLESDLFFRLSKEPWRLREEILPLLDRKKITQPVIIDEVQKIPALLDEIHWLIENKKLGFILCGSSARKLKRSHANMLGGRAWRFELHPLTSRELGKKFDLLKALNRGLIPEHYLDENYARSIKAYINDYLNEEIKYEGLVRNLPAFARFLDSIPFSDGELVNFSRISSECGVDAKTAAEYYRILVDTLLGTFIEPFRRRKKRKDIISTPKFYLFDTGVSGGLSGRVIHTNRGAEFGRAFEQLILMELLAHRSYTEKDYAIDFWRTKDGMEVDFILADGDVAIEVKGSSHLGNQEMRGMLSFMRDSKPGRALIVCQEPSHRKLSSGIEIMPWRLFLEMLWGCEIV